MRAVFFDKLRQAFDSDPNLFFLTGDTGFNLVEPLFEAAPNRALNVGVAEQNMVGIAAGLCNAGFVPVCYGITNFLVHRCFEQMRNDICLHGHKAIFVGTSAGFDNGALGATHHMVDDLACLKALPNLGLYSPGSRESIKVIFDEVVRSSGASFIRITKSDFSLGHSALDANHFVIEETGSLLVIAHGRMVKQCFEAHRQQGGFSLFAMDRIKPLNDGLLAGLFDRYASVVVVEDNFRSGLFNSLCQWVIEHSTKNRTLTSISPIERFESRVGDTTYLDQKHGLLPEQIAETLGRMTSTLAHQA
jgi:transketolase